MSTRLVLYSDQIETVTEAIDERLFSMLPSVNPTIGYLPSSPDPDRIWFKAREDHYAAHGAILTYFGLEAEFDATRIEELLECDAIHLTGGNTFQFLYWLRHREMISVLQRFVSDGGVLIGVSAGAILMTPDISTSYLCGDTPYPGLDDYSGLELVDFAFAPHFDNSPATLLDVLKFSHRFNGPVYAVSDGGGVVVGDGGLEMFGDVWTFRDGEITPSNK